MRYPRFAALATAALLAAASQAETDDWSSFRGPAGTGRVAEGLPSGEGEVLVEMSWKRSLGSGYSGVAIAGDMLVTAMEDGERDYVVALDATSGEERWRYDLDATYPGHDGSHDGPIATPAIAAGRALRAASLRCVRSRSRSDR